MSNYLLKIAVISLFGFPLAILGSRFGVFNFKVGIMLVALTFLLSVLVFIFSLFISLKFKTIDPVNANIAAKAMFISLLPAIGIGAMMLSARNVPQIHNISTDVIDPPNFFKIAEIRSSEHNSLEYDIEALAKIQQAAYPGVTSLTVNMSLDKAQQQATNTADSLGWRIINNDPELGIIEATETSLLWGFTDDIVIRLRSNQTDDQVTIDLRSVSRVGRSDLGANAKRIESFLVAFSDNS